MDSNKSTWQSLVDAYHSAENFLGDMPIAKAIGGVIANPTPQEVGAQAVNLGKDISKGIQQFTDTAMTDPAAAGSLVSPMAGMIAYHGTPHKIVGGFKKSAIGSGEGRQAFGHGFYATEEKGIAKDYAGMNPPTSIPPRRAINGIEVMPGTPEYHATTLIKTGDRTLRGARKEVQGWIDNAKPGEDIEHYKKVLSTLNNINKKSEVIELPHRGHVYTLDIPEPDVMLDWDKPLSQQSKEAKAIMERYLGFEGGKLPADYSAIKSPSGEYLIVQEKPSSGPFSVGRQIVKYGRFQGHKTPEEAIKGYFDNIGGKELYDTMSKDLGGPAAASEYLYQQGVKGIRYKAGQISGAKTDAYNYVIFEPEDIKITAEEFLDKD